MARPGEATWAAVAIYGGGVGILLYHLAFFASGRANRWDWLVMWIAPAFLLASLWFLRRWTANDGIDGTYLVRVAGWYALGMALFAFAAIVQMTYQEAQGGRIVRDVYASVQWVTGGAVIGLLVGMYDADRKRRTDQTTRLNEGLAVLNRVLRHDIRNEMNVVDGYVQLLGDDPSAIDERVATIREHVDRVVQLSENARDMERLLDADGSGGIEIERVDVVARLEDRLERFGRAYPSVEIEVAAPDAASVAAPELIDAALDNVLENAVEHNDSGTPRIDVGVGTVWADGREYVEIRIADNGPGIPAREREALRTGRETPLEHSRGMGLWLARWTVGAAGGHVAFGENEPRGSVVSLRLPTASRPGGPLAGTGPSGIGAASPD